MTCIHILYIDWHFLLLCVCIINISSSWCLVVHSYSSPLLLWLDTHFSGVVGGGKNSIKEIENKPKYSRQIYDKKRRKTIISSM